MPGPKCTICQRPDVGAIEDALAAGESIAKAAKRYKISSATLGKHKLKCKAAGRRERAPLVVEELPPLAASASPQDHAAWHCERVKRRMIAAEGANLPAREIAAYQSQYTNALKHHARLSGALDITETQILKSAPWAKIMAHVAEVLRKHPEAALALAKAMRELSDNGDL